MTNFISRWLRPWLDKLVDMVVADMIGENRQQVAAEPVEIQVCRKTTDRFRGIYRIYPNSVKENRRMSTCNRLNLQTLGSQPVMPKNLPDHCSRASDLLL